MIERKKMILQLLIGIISGMAGSAIGLLLYFEIFA